MKPQFKDLFSGHSLDYRKFRPSYPSSLFAHLASLAPSRGAAWDVGCGNGQASISLANHFDVVYATDPSAEQLTNAQAHPKIRYFCARAETSGLTSSSVDLVISAQAYHWFNHDAFVQEIARVSVPKAVVCIWCYDLCEISPEVDPIVKKLYDDILGGYWEPERRLVDQKYAKVTMPFEKIPMPDFDMTVEWSFAQFMGYLHTWSAVQKFKAVNKADPIELIATRLQDAFGMEGTRSVRWTLSPRAWRIWKTAPTDYASSNKAKSIV